MNRSLAGKKVTLGGAPGLDRYRRRRRRSRAGHAYAANRSEEPVRANIGRERRHDAFGAAVEPHDDLVAPRDAA